MSELTAGAAGARHAGADHLFGLRKTWWDPAPGIEMVQIHFAWTPPDGEPDWESAESRVMTPGELSRLRTAVLEVPRELDGSREYLLHHFFYVVRGTEWVSSPVFTEEVVTREVTWTDETGDWTHVGIGWGVSPGAPGLAAPNYTAAAMDGLTFEDAGAGAPPEPSPIHEFVRAQPLPHVFRGLVWGPRGADVRYVVHLVRAGSPRPEEDAEAWEDNGGAGWTITL
ncbi:hypothetical protein [Geodermatophilus marinus]|uniref:hypothetical protein n=1 Tax=Geodermatophilus sp. LHW52908 TaxID=2303986 RepID=UPI000E3C8469|nr:hypothetical protein [Geodermatophilus sp. LHW52908]RFU21993.1 hypothetical protein D0Z06_07630 [Geodermatophilus sp. LHW52908]